MRQELLITRTMEEQAIDTLIELFKANYPNVNASNALVVMVSPDYSATAAMHLAHALSHNKEMCDILCLDVPYPDQDVDRFLKKAGEDIYSHLHHNKNQYEYVILVEAGVIRGSNYKWLTRLFDVVAPVPWRVITTALYENTGSSFKSDVVAHYYDNDKEDLTFYYEQPNKHWV